MNALREMATDFRDKRLWAVVAALLAVLVAVPVLLSKSASAPAKTASVPAAVPSGPSLPVVSASQSPNQTHLSGRSHDPFSGGASAGGSGSTTQGSKSSTTPSSATASKPGGTSSGTSGGSSTPVPTVTGSPSVPAPITTTPTAHKRAPASLRSSQVYRVALAVSWPSGGLDTIDPLERLSVLPNDRQPLLVELGVQKGGGRVLFAVEPGAVVSGPGTCTPGPIDCQVLSLAVGQNENLSSQSPTGPNEVALFAVTSITAHSLGSSSAAATARRRVSAAGRDELASSQQNVVSLFRYEPALGAVVDLRNLSIGG